MLDGIEELEKLVENEFYEKISVSLSKYERKSIAMCMRVCIGRLLEMGLTEYSKCEDGDAKEKLKFAFISNNARFILRNIFEAVISNKIKIAKKVKKNKDCSINGRNFKSFYIMSAFIQAAVEVPSDKSLDEFHRGRISGEVLSLVRVIRSSVSYGIGQFDAQSVTGDGCGPEGTATDMSRPGYGW